MCVCVRADVIKCGESRFDRSSLSSKFCFLYAEETKSALKFYFVTSQARLALFPHSFIFSKFSFALSVELAYATRWDIKSFIFLLVAKMSSHSFVSTSNTRVGS